MKNVGNKLRRTLALLLCAAALLSVTAFGATSDVNGSRADDARELRGEWTSDQRFALADPAPWNPDELKKVVDVQDPRSVAAYWVWAVTRLADSYDDGMAMMKYLFADLEVYGRGFTEGGMSGRAGWDPYFNERLSADLYKWLPRAYFAGANAANGFLPSRPLTVELHYNKPNTEAANNQSLQQLGRLTVVYWVKSSAGGNQVNINLCKFADSDRWYVTNGAAGTTLYYDQQNGLGATSEERQAALALAAKTKGDASTAEEHAARYAGNAQQPVQPEQPARSVPFTDVPESGLYADAVSWAYNKGVTQGTSETTFGTKDSCTRGQVVTFLWRAAGCPAPRSSDSPFRDVNPGDYYYDAVLWAVEQGVTGGTSADAFSPEQTCSTAHIITFLYRAMGAGTDGWYAEAGSWADSKGLLEGTDLTISPDATCPRGDVAAFLFRAYGQ